MDIYDYLKADHKKVSDLFALYEKTTAEKIKIDIATMIIDELFIHAETEQATFYKTLEEYAVSEDAALHGEKEHAEIEALMTELATVRKTSKDFDNKMKRLKKLVAHHVKEEEGEIFKKAKKVLSQEQALILKEKMHYLKGEVAQALE
jgi:hemerythrin superfamily protein